MVQRKTNRSFTEGTPKKDLRPSQVYRILSGFSDEAIVFLVAKWHAAIRETIEPAEATPYAYVKHRTIRTALTGQDLRPWG